LHVQARQKINPEEQELIMQLSPLYLEKIQAAEQRGEQKGRQAGERALTLKLLQKRFGSLSAEMQGQIAGLSVERLERLVEGLLDFNNVEELVDWLDRDSN
jgi:predicted transposase YdaD